MISNKSFTFVVCWIKFAVFQDEWMAPIPWVIKNVRWRHFLWFDWLSFDFLYAENVSRFRSYPVRMAHGYLYVYWITITNNIVLDFIAIYLYLSQCMIRMSFNFFNYLHEKKKIVRERLKRFWNNFLDISLPKVPRFN